ncbi:hypothetical protein B0O99DRAFT_512903 [Bisporella sp. PMI_857]|nr:hypothetical protein B0O99DRAFT_512903 [Bisporella sp. PMI_857]
MRSGLLRLLHRSASLQNLGQFIARPSTESATRRIPWLALQGHHVRPQTELSAAHDLSYRAHPHDIEPEKIDPVEAGTDRASTNQLQVPDYHTSWKWLSPERLDHESDLDSPHCTIVRNSKNKSPQLWAQLLDYRVRIYGRDGAYMYWRAVKRGDFVLPATGGPHDQFARRFWTSFLKYALNDEIFLFEMWKYASQVLESGGDSWLGRKLYAAIIEHRLCSWKRHEAQDWHNRLFRCFAPDKGYMAWMCRWVVAKRGDMDGLLKIYSENIHRDNYSNIVGRLCAQGDFQTALKWHFALVKLGDVPTTYAAVKPLIDFLTVYYHDVATRVMQSVKVNGISLEPGVPTSNSKTTNAHNHTTVIEDSMQENMKISRVMMNLLHGKRFGITPKEYNDSYGAKWFATTWISLDIAMTTIGALGVESIGPLSLQAIALRERNAEGITRRINQLQDIGISLGNSLFCRALEDFARNQKQELIDSLLASDQHPDVLEDRQLQDKLMSSYAGKKDWPRYRLALAIRFISSSESKWDIENIVLGSYSTVGDTSSMLVRLRKIQMAGTPVQAKTIKYILTHVLKKRRKGRRPVVQKGSEEVLTIDDLEQAIEILKGIMLSGSFVPVTIWQEIIKRMGMLLRMDDLATLCDFLATWYGPAHKAIFLDVQMAHRWHRFQVPDAVPTSHSLHPLTILFPKVRQQAIAHWGIMSGLAERNIGRWKPRPRIDSGIMLLKRLNQRGVYIYMNEVRKSILQRLLLLYGSGQSNSLRNRAEKRRNPLSLDEAVSQVNEAFERPFLDMDRVLEYLANEPKRIARRDRKRFHSLRTRDPSVRWR